MPPPREHCSIVQPLKITVARCRFSVDVRRGVTYCLSMATDTARFAVIFDITADSATFVQQDGSEGTWPHLFSEAGAQSMLPTMGMVVKASEVNLLVSP